MEDDEYKPWEVKPTGPAPKETPVIVAFDLFKIFRWLKKKMKKEKK